MNPPWSHPCTVHRFRTTLHLVPLTAQHTENGTTLWEMLCQPTSSSHSFLFHAFCHPYKELVLTLPLHRSPTWGRNPNSKFCQMNHPEGTVFVQKFLNAPIIPYPSPGPKEWGFQLTGAHPLSPSLRREDEATLHTASRLHNSAEKAIGIF